MEQFDTGRERCVSGFLSEAGRPPFGITAGDANGFYPTGDPQFDEYRLQDRGSFRAIELRRFFAAQAVEYAMANVILGEN